MKTENLDNALRSALHSDAQPGETLLAKTGISLRRAQYRPAPKVHRVHRGMRIAAVAALVCLCLTTTVVAALRLLPPREVAQQKGDETLAAAFAEGALPVYESREAGDYRFTLMELVWGEDITDLPFASSSVTPSRLYSVLAVERLDGEPMEELGFAGLTVTPLIHAHNPMDYSLYSLNSASFEVYEDGVLYRLVECDDIAMFADNEIYLLASVGAFFLDAIRYDEATGDIILNPDCDSPSVLFTLPIPPEYADAEKAEAYRETLEGRIADTEEEKEIEEWPEGRPDFRPVHTPEFFERAVPVEESRQLLVPDEEGCLTFTYYAEDGRGGSDTTQYSYFLELLEESGTSIVVVGAGSDGVRVWATCFYMEEDGSVYGVEYTALWEELEDLK